MIIQLGADKGILGGGKKKIIVSVDYAKPLAQAIPNILSKLLLTKKESFQLFFTTHSCSLESSLAHGDASDPSEVSSAGGLTVSSAGGNSNGVGDPPAKKGAKKVVPIPHAVDWNASPQQLGLRMAGCYLWIRRTVPGGVQAPAAGEGAEGADEAATPQEDAERLLADAKAYDPAAPFEYVYGITVNSVPTSFVAKRDISAGQVIFREALEPVEGYTHALVEYIRGNKMLSTNLPFDKTFTAPSSSPSHTDEQWSKALSQATTNGVALGETLGFAPWFSVFSHSCWPNAMSFLSPDKRTVDVVAIDNIALGDDVTLPWNCIVDEFWLPHDRRNEHVLQRQEKPCKCGRCLHPSDEDKTLTGAYVSGEPGTGQLAVKVMREAYAAALDSDDKQPLLSFIQQYQKAETDAGDARSPVQLHKHHWRLCNVRSRLLDWYRVAPKKRMDKRLPGVLLDQLEMCSAVMPKFWPPKLKPYRQWEDMVRMQSAHVQTLLQRMANERTHLDLTTFAQLDALERYWDKARASNIPRIATPTHSEDEDDW
eukprot:Rhum_TRINITY_DN15181_c12_g1::Rhum_TRINITY_DN15181_c12_g1_i1::g.143392::m.143392